MCTGVASEQLLEELEELRRSEGQAQDGRMFALVYTGETEHFRLQEQAHQLFSGKHSKLSCLSLPFYDYTLEQHLD